MQENVQVLGVQEWSLTDEVTGEVKSGLSVYYLPNATPDDGRSHGLIPVKQSMGVEHLKTFKGKVPGHFTLQFTQRATSKGVMLRLVGAASAEKAAG